LSSFKRCEYIYRPYVSLIVIAQVSSFFTYLNLSNVIKCQLRATCHQNYQHVPTMLQVFRHMLKNNCSICDAYMIGNLSPGVSVARQAQAQSEFISSRHLRFRPHSSRPKMWIHLVPPDTGLHKHHFPALKVGLQPPGFEPWTTELENHKSELLLNPTTRLFLDQYKSTSGHNQTYQTRFILSPINTIMFKPSLFVILGAAIIGQTRPAASAQMRSTAPELISSEKRLAKNSKQCKEQFVLKHSCISYKCICCRKS
jgi:hypothetical protein